MYAGDANGGAVEHVVEGPEGGAEDVQEELRSQRTIKEGVGFVESEGEGACRGLAEV